MSLSVLVVVGSAVAADERPALRLEVEAGTAEVSSGRQVLGDGVRVVLLDDEGALLELVADRAERSAGRTVLEAEAGVELRAPDGAATRARGAGLLPWLQSAGLDARDATVRARRVVVDERGGVLDLEGAVVEGRAAGQVQAELRLETAHARLHRPRGEWTVTADRLRLRLRAPAAR